MEHDFKNGDTVQLKSGGPEMTIEGIGEYGIGVSHDTAKCIWFDGKNVKDACFELHTLTKSY